MSTNDNSNVPTWGHTIERRYVNIIICYYCEIHLAHYPHCIVYTFSTLEELLLFNERVLPVEERPSVDELLEAMAENPNYFFYFHVENNFMQLELEFRLAFGGFLLQLLRGCSNLEHFNYVRNFINTMYTTIYRIYCEIVIDLNIQSISNEDQDTQTSDGIENVNENEEVNENEIGLLYLTPYANSEVYGNVYSNMDDIYDDVENNMDISQEQSIFISDIIPIFSRNPDNEPADNQEPSWDDNPQSLTPFEEGERFSVGNLPIGLATFSNGRTNEITNNYEQIYEGATHMDASRFNIHVDNPMNREDVEASTTTVDRLILNRETMRTGISEHEEHRGRDLDTVFDASRAGSATEENELVREQILTENEDAAAREVTQREREGETNNESETEPQSRTYSLRRLNLEFGNRIISQEREHPLGADMIDTYISDIIDIETERSLLKQYESEIYEMFTFNNG